MSREVIRLLHVFSTFAVGGPQSRFATLANALGNKYHHQVIAMDGRYHAAKLLDHDAPVTCIPLNYEKGNARTSLPLFRHTLKQINPHRLITYNWGSIEWGLINLWRPIPHVHLEEGFGPEEIHSQIPRRVWMRRLALSRTPTIMVPSHHLYDIATKIWRFPAKRVHYLPNGVNIDRFHHQPDATLLQRWQLDPEQQCIIGTVTALRAEKNLSRLLRAFTELKSNRPLRLVIIGDGPMRATLESEAQQLGIADQVLFLGHMDQPEHLISAFQIYALSSDTEQMPLGILEAMAAGVAVASVDVGDVRRMVSEPNQSYVSGTDNNALCQNLNRLIDDPALCNQLGLANHEKAMQEYDLKLMLSRYDALFSTNR
ncbi:MAG: glycosyltransferase family 4 protein [Magnetococcales bacterium]|nr:glycosyltransferase family 4 protein [Magnetococcales bacterium]